jgi:hypothetical protein
VPIKPDDYNTARNILVQAGSDSASKSHPKHNTDSVPDTHGKDLLAEARDEFRSTDAGGDDLRSEMSQDHYTAIHKAADEMGIDQW